MARLVATLAFACLLAGCASSPADPAAPPADAATPVDGPDAGAADAASQEETFAWLVSGIACAHASETQEAIYASLRPELEGITYASAAVDPASFGQEWVATVVDSPSLVGFEVTFWEGAVGGEVLAL